MREKAKYFDDRTGMKLPELEIGQEVRIAQLKKKNCPWKSGTCVEKLSGRSCLVETGSMTLRRNGQALKPVLSKSVAYVEHPDSLKTRITVKEIRDIAR